MIVAQVHVLRGLQQAIGDIERLIADRVTAHPRARLLSELPGIGTINLAQVLAEVGPILDRVNNAEQPAAECGAAPVTRASGKTNGVYFRWAANTRARKAMTSFAHNSRAQSPWAPAPLLQALPRAPGLPMPAPRRPRPSLGNQDQGSPRRGLTNIGVSAWFADLGPGLGDALHAEIARSLGMPVFFCERASHGSDRR